MRRIIHTVKHYQLPVTRGALVQQVRFYSHGHGNRGNEDDRHASIMPRGALATIGSSFLPSTEELNEVTELAGKAADKSYDLLLDQTLDKFQRAIDKARDLDVESTTVSAQMNLGVMSLTFSAEIEGQDEDD